jgi:hypothetical protein
VNAVDFEAAIDNIVGTKLLDRRGRSGQSIRTTSPG